MSNRFVFRGFQDTDTERSANQRLARILDGAPYDSTSSALLEKVDGRFFASIDIYSTHGPFIARVSAETASEAVDKALAKVSELLEHWRALRFSHQGRVWGFPFADMGRA